MDFALSIHPLVPNKWKFWCGCLFLLMHYLKEKVYIESSYLALEFPRVILSAGINFESSAADVIIVYSGDLLWMWTGFSFIV